MEQIEKSAIMNRIADLQRRVGSGRAPESTMESSRSWSSEIERYLRHWSVADDVIEASAGCLERAKTLCEVMEKSQRGLFFHGLQGRGKTTLAAAILRYEMERFFKKQSPYKSIQFLFIPDLLMELQSCFAPGSEKSAADVIRRVGEYDFLVLDGAGEGGRQTEFVIGALGTLIHRRDAERKTKRTIVTSNFNLRELAERMDARIASRIAGMCDEVPFTGTDRRLNVVLPSGVMVR